MEWQKPNHGTFSLTLMVFLLVLGGVELVSLYQTDHIHFCPSGGYVTYLIIVYLEWMSSLQII
jgi:hypothetical protein